MNILFNVHVDDDEMKLFWRPQADQSYQCTMYIFYKQQKFVHMHPASLEAHGIMAIDLKWKGIAAKESFISKYIPGIKYLLCPSPNADGNANALLIR